MKRYFWTTAVLFVLGCVGLCFIPPVSTTYIPTADASTYNKVYSVAVGASAERLIIPTYNGEAFRGERMDIFFSGGTGGNVSGCSVTVYIPLNMGPLAATDSFLVPLRVGIYTEDVLIYEGPISDTLRIETATFFGGSVLVYQ